MKDRNKTVINYQLWAAVFYELSRSARDNGDPDPAIDNALTAAKFARLAREKMVET